MASDTGTDELSDTAGGEHNRLETLGKYRIVRRIGAGGMGTVFLAVDDSLNRTVALKVLPKDRAGNPVLVRRFKAEGQAAAHLEHPNIVRVFEAGEADGFLYMALEYIEGIDVHELVERRGVIPVKRSTDIIRQTTLALQHADERGIVHRDIKPSNLLIRRDGSVKLADMGLARSVDDTLETNITRAGTTVGTVDYMSPEQARNSKAADVRSDIYSLGCTWYHMLTGHPPFPDGSMTNKLQAHAMSTRPDPRSENDRVPEGIVAIIQRMMACKPDDRYQSPQELLEDLEIAGRMTRGVDESALAALANDSTQWDETADVDEPELRMSDDIDALDLAALTASGEHDVADAPAPSPSRPVRPHRKSKSQKPSPSPSRTSSRPSEEPEYVDVPPSGSEHRTPRTRAGSAATIADTDTASRAERVTPVPEIDDPEAADQPSRMRMKPVRGDAGRSRGSQRLPKRGSVRAAGGQAPTLPPKESTGPVDASATKGVNLEALKYIVPAVLVVAALVAAGFAVFRGGDAFSGSGGANPYVDGKQDNGLPAAPVKSRAADKPKADAVPEKPDDNPPPQVTAVPFPGAEDADISASEMKELIPGWVNAFRTPSGRAERTIVVRRGSDGDNEVATLHDALSRLPREGGTIELNGDGPFRLEAVELVNRGRVRIQAADGRRPVVQLRPPPDWKSGPLVRFVGTDAEFDGLHFVLVDAGEAGATIFHVERANVSLRNCSLTVDRRDAPRITALRVVGGGGRAGGAMTGKCLLENVLIRGRSVTSVSLEGATSELVVGNCLLASGDAPAIVVRDDGPAATARGIDPPTRAVRLLATTIVAAPTAIQLNHDGDAADVVPTDVVTRKSLVLSPDPPGGGSATTLLALHGWPAGDGGLGGSRVHGLNWAVDHAVYAGWDHLLTWWISGSDPVATVSASTDEWRRFWNQPLGSESVIGETIAVDAPAEVTPDDVQAALTVSVPAIQGKHPPGARAEDFEPLPLGLIEHVVAGTRQPYEPDWLGVGMVVNEEVVRFDLSLRRSLANFLSSDACPDGTHVVAFGSGLKELEPVEIENKSIRLEFESAGKTPLLLQPKPARDGAPAEEAWITVKNGRLDLVNAPMKLPASRTYAYPKSILLLHGASLALRNSTIEGPRQKLEDASPLVRWETAEAASTARAVLVENSFVIGAAPALGGPVQWQSLILRNCILVSRSRAIAFDVTADDQLPAALVLDHCTLAAGEAAISAGFAPSVSAAAGPFTVYARACVFAGPTAANESGSVVVAHSSGAAEEHSLVWWGSANGYSTRLAGYRQNGSIVSERFEDWNSAWGSGHEANPLTGAADVLLASPLPDVSSMEARNFQLAASAAAANWGPAAEAIGANPAEIGPTHHEKAPASSQPPTNAQPRSANPLRRDAGF